MAESEVDLCKIVRVHHGTIDPLILLLIVNYL